MKFVIAPDSFKENLSSVDVARAIEIGLKEAIPNAHVHKIPIADGGEGTVDAILAATGGEKVQVKVTDPLGNQIDAYFGILPNAKTAVIELAAASGLYLVPLELRNPLVTTTKGTGELIRAALDYGVEEIIIGIGGSATNDCGAGLLQALGVKLLDESGDESHLGGGTLHKINKIDISEVHPRVNEVKFKVACDVNNPLVGISGASAVYGPQKGATQEMVEMLDKNLLHFGKLMEYYFNKKIIEIPGSGAAGGVGAALIAFLNADLRPGIDLLIDLTKMETKIKQADFVITGEGKIDWQTLHGKAPIGIAKLAKKYGKPVYAIAGTLGDGSGDLLEAGIDATFSITTGPMPLEQAQKDAFQLVQQTALNIGNVIKTSKKFQ